MLIQFERVKIESRKNLNSRSTVKITLIHLSCLTYERDVNFVIRTLDEIHVILVDGLPEPLTIFLFTCLVFRANTFLVLHAQSVKKCLRCNLTHYFRRFNTALQ